MAVVKMNHLSIIGLESDKTVLLNRLMELGVVEIVDQSEKLQDQEWAAVARRDGDEDQVSGLESELAQIQTALDTIARYDTAKKPLFSTRKPVTRKEYETVLGDGLQIREEVSKVLALHDRWGESKSEENVIVSTQASLKPWASYELPLESQGTRSVRILNGVIPAVSDAEALKAQVSEASPATVVTVISRDEEQQYLNVFYMKDDEDAVLDVMKSNGFTTAVFKDLTGTVSENMQRLDARLQEVKAQEGELEKQIGGCAAMKESIRYYYDSRLLERDKAKATSSLLRTKKAFCLGGWIIASKQKAVQGLAAEFGCVCDVTIPEKGEETPVLLDNKSLVVPFEAITTMYAYPKSYEVDPTPIFAIFYFVFYGMMFADMGYGAILAIACFTVLKKFRLEGTAYRLIKCMGFCGISTFIWGALYGGFMGNLLTVVAETFFNVEFVITPLWFDPLADPMKLLIFSCVLGALHLFVGMGIKAYMYIREGKIVEAINEVFAWYVFLIGLVLLLGGDMLFDGASGIGKWMTIAGAVVIFAIPLFKNKGIGKLLGLWDLYGTTSYLADVLSYSRLLALGLASAVIAQVFNQLGALFGNGIIAVILFIVIAVIGHVLNFAINALGSYVHASRLQYVEFFGKFYEGGGIPFKPFAKNTKYVKIKEEE